MRRCQKSHGFTGLHSTGFMVLTEVLTMSGSSLCSRCCANFALTRGRLHMQQSKDYCALMYVKLIHVPQRYRLSGSGKLKANDDALLVHAKPLCNSIPQ